jgi:hypothetical protein
MITVKFIPSDLLIVEWILKYGLSFLFHQELPERLLLTYKPEEEEVREPVPIVEEKLQVVEEPAPVPSSQIASPPKPEIADTGDLLVSMKIVIK